MPTFNTRIQNKIDTYAKWVENNPTPLNGEICIVTVSADDSAVKQKPAVLIKVGNGTDDFNTLPFIGAKAADVSSWALADSKPEYKADEITGLEEFVQGISDIDTNTEYQFTLANNIITIQKKDVGGAYADYQTIDLTSAFNAKADKVTNATAGNFAGLDVNGNLTDSGKKAADFATAAQVDTLEKYVGTFTPVGTETTVVGYVDAKINAIPAQTDYSVSVAETTPEGYAKTYTFSQLGNTIATINIPKDMVVSSGSVVTDPEGQAAGTYIKLVLANAENDELFINVGDLIEYVTGGTATDGMITVAVDENYVATATINDGTVTLAKLEASVQTAIGKAHEHANKALLDTYTQTEADLADAVGKKHEHTNKGVLDGITAEKVSQWDAAQANVLENVAGVEGSITDKTFTVTGVSTDILKQGSDVIIFNCGDSKI